MQVCPSTVLNSDASENVVYNNPDFPAYIKKGQQNYPNKILLKDIFLLRNTTMSITEIAYACGFSNTSYFCELFRQYYDTTPGKYRKNH